MKPDGWVTRRLGEVATLQRGFDLPTRTRREGRVPVISSSGASGTHDVPAVKAPGVVTGRYGTIGEVFFVETDFWPLNTTLWVSDFHGNDPLFVSYLLRELDFSAHSGKSGVPGVNRNDLHHLEVALPVDVDAQREMATILADADRLISAIDGLIAKKRMMREGSAQQLLTGGTRLPGFKDKWSKWTLGEIAHIKTGTRNNQDKVKSGRYPFFVRSAVVEQIDSYGYDCEAILVPGEGGVGSIFHYINGKFDVHQRVYKISDFHQIAVGRFIYFYLRQFFGPHAMRNTVKATVDSLRLPTFKEFELWLPSVEEQKAVVAVLSDADAELDTLGLRLAKAEAMRQGMAQRLLTGRASLPMMERHPNEVAA